MATFFSAVYEVPYQWLTLLFDSMVNVVTTVNERGVLTLDRIKLALTGRSESASFLSVWEEIIREKRSSGKAGTAENYENAYRCFTSLTGFTYADGFAVDSTVISKWIESMTERLSCFQIYPS